MITAKPLPKEPPVLSDPAQGRQGRVSLPASGRIRRVYYTAAKRPSAALGPWVEGAWRRETSSIMYFGA
jgi:hypothetical protein